MSTELQPWSPPWGLAIAMLALAVITISWSRSYFRPQHIPGPPLAAFSKLCQVQKTIGSRVHLDTVEVCERYGTIPILNQRRLVCQLMSDRDPLVRIGPNELVTNDFEIFLEFSAVRSQYTVITGTIPAS